MDNTDTLTALVALTVAAVPATAIGLVLLNLAGAGAFAAWVGVFSGAVAVLIDPWAGVLFMVAGAVLAVSQRMAVARLAERAAELAVDHAQELAIRRAQLLRVGAYGVIDRRAWDAEIERFIAGVVMPVLGDIPTASSVWPAIRAAIERASTSIAPTTDFRAGLSPVEYELLVADTLRRAGWDARTTKGSGDQGIDVVANMGSVRLVLQCKLYGRPVGNGAVQEAIAGQRFEQATHAAVVSNAGYTRAAQELAGAAGVLLLHHEELAGLAARINGRETEPIRRLA